MTDQEANDARVRQTIEDFRRVYEGLSETEIEEVEAIIKQRPELYRHFPEIDELIDTDPSEWIQLSAGRNHRVQEHS